MTTVPDQSNIIHPWIVVKVSPKPMLTKESDVTYEIRRKDISQMCSFQQYQELLHLLLALQRRGGGL